MKKYSRQLVSIAALIIMFPSAAKSFLARQAVRTRPATVSSVRPWLSLSSAIAPTTAITPSRQRLSAAAASSSSGEESIVDICTAKIKDALDAVDVKVTGAYDDPNGSHISIEVVSPKFEGKRPVQRQQLVYKAIWQELQGPVHAVDSMVCKAPSEA